MHAHKWLNEEFFANVFDYFLGVFSMENEVVLASWLAG